jgi:hypothetical protein
MDVGYLKLLFYASVDLSTSFNITFCNFYTCDSERTISQLLDEFIRLSAPSSFPSNEMATLHTPDTDSQFGLLNISATQEVAGRRSVIKMGFSIWK